MKVWTTEKLAWLNLSLMVLSRLAQPCPVSPRPWRKIMEAVCLILGFNITGFREDLIMVSRARTPH